jgi:TniQ
MRPEPLPRTAAPMLDECLDSYLRRLAQLNRLDAVEFRAFLAESRRKAAPVRAELLSILTDYPEANLRWAILGLWDPQELTDDRFSNRPRTESEHRIHACICCAAAADAVGPVELFARHEEVICLRHQRWTATHPPGQFP